VIALREGDFHCNVFHYPKKRPQSIVVVEQPQQLQRRNQRHNADIHYARIANQQRLKRAKLKRIRLASINYAQLRKEHSSYDATQILGKLLKDVFLAHEISKIFEDALHKEFEKNGSAIELR
jgi:hypothetical protein